MSPERWQQLEKLFHAAEALKGAERVAFLDRECSGDEQLRKEVEALIASSETGILKEAVARATRGLEAPVEALGNYKILGELGEGGMGVVFEAEQQSPRRKVALKMMRGGRYAGERMRRLFQREVEALGRLKHPVIATIYESGESDDGQPYLAMELVGGKKLDEWLRENPPGTQLRKTEALPLLRVFRSICDGVIYAHQNGVIHRDIKPSNIFVQGQEVSTQSGSTSQRALVKILDFGLARFTDVQQEEGQTQTGVVQGSLPYMSPEQARGETDKIDTRTDIYSLGVLLYVFLTGKHPYMEITPALPEAVTRICEAPPTPFKAHFAKWDEDLETIARKALEKKPKDRYQSATALAADIDSYIADQPISARAPSAIYQLGKLVRRNRAAVGALLLALATLIAFTGVTIYQRQRADREAATAKQVSAFLTALFRDASPTTKRGTGELSARDLLRTGRKRLEKELKDQPELRARLLDEIGEAYNAIGPYEEAKSAFEESLSIRGGAYGPDDPRGYDSWRGLCIAAYNQGDFKTGAQACEKGLRILESSRPQSDEDFPRMLSSLATAYAAEGQPLRAEPLARRAVELDTRFRREGTAGAASRLEDLGHVLRVNNNYAEAAEYLERSIKEQTGLKGELYGAGAMNELGIALNRLGRYEESVQNYKRLEDLVVRIYGPDNLNRASVRNNIGFAYLGLERWKDAEEAARFAIALHEKLGGKNPRLSDGFGLLAQAQEGQGLEKDALTSWRSAYGISAAGFGKDHFRTAATGVQFGRSLCRNGKADEGLAMAKQGLDRLIALERGELMDGALAWRQYGEALAAAGKSGEARQAIQRSLDLFTKLFGADNIETRNTRKILERVKP
jgi:eukaryotic-like serine/threonine-protein kinase